MGRGSRYAQWFVGALTFTLIWLATSCGDDPPKRVRAGEVGRGTSRIVTARVTAAEVDFGDELRSCEFASVEGARREPPASPQPVQELGRSLLAEIVSDGAISGDDECAARLRVTALEGAALGDYVIFVRITYRYRDAGDDVDRTDDSPGQVLVTIVP